MRYQFPQLCKSLVRTFLSMASLSSVSEGKNPIEVGLPHEVIGLVTLATMHAINWGASLELMKAMEQGEMVTVLKTLHHVKW